MANDPNAPQQVPSELIAIDILLQPGGAMLDRAAADNARLLSVFPAGFAEHMPSASARPMDHRML